MAKMVKTICALVFGALPAASYLGQVVASFESPAYNPHALATDGNNLYVLCGGPRLVYSLKPDGGSVIGSFPAPFGSYTYGLGYENGGYLWTGYNKSWIEVARCRTTTGSIYSSYTVVSHDNIAGVACEGDPGKPSPIQAVVSVTCGGLFPNKVMRHTAGGSLISSFNYPTDKSFRDPAWDYANELIWFPHFTSANPHIYGYTTSGLLITSFAAPDLYPFGMTYYEGYLWVSTLYWPEYIYKIHCPPGLNAVTPTSLGRVKALYR
jgi:hypothetical protein